MLPGAIIQDIRLFFNPPNGRRKSCNVITTKPMKYFISSQHIIHEKLIFFFSFKQKINQLEILSQAFYAFVGNCSEPANVVMKGCVILSSVTWEIARSWRCYRVWESHHCSWQRRASRSNRRYQRWYQLGHCLTAAFKEAAVVCWAFNRLPKPSGSDWIFKWESKC